MFERRVPLHAVVPDLTEYRQIADADLDADLTVSVHLRADPALAAERRAIYEDQLRPVYDRQSAPASREHLRVLYRAALDERDLIERFAVQSGLSVEAAEEYPTSIVRLRGPLRQHAAAFGITPAIYEHIDGHRALAHEEGVSIPDELADTVIGVLGLDHRPFLHPSISGPPEAVPGIMPNAVAAYYNFPTGTGVGQTVALIEVTAGYNISDFTDYFSLMAQGIPSVTYVGVDGQPNAPSIDSHTAELYVDVGLIGGIVPGARQIIYNTPINQGFADGVAAAVHDLSNRPSVILICFGDPEQSPQFTTYQPSMDQALEAAVVGGVTVVVATGDFGNPVYPSTSPNVLAVGGTFSQQSGSFPAPPEVVWNSQTLVGSSGGGYSVVYPRPSWQTPNLQPARGVPDVSAVASSTSNWNVPAIGGGVVQAGGTSEAAPVWAGLIALLNAQRQTPVGFINPTLYANPQALVDITQGTNGFFPAGPGWDAATGLGVPIGTSIAAVLAGGVVGNTPEIQSISPASGPAGNVVVINGQNLLPVTEVLFGGVPSQSVTAVSSTQVAAVVPAGAGIVDARVQTTAGISPITPADQFSYTGSGGGIGPAVTSVSPNTGPTSGGTLVTINGQNFSPGTVIGVFFGTTPAASVPLIQPNVIQAVAPPGVGTVDIVVQMSTGISSPTVADQFTYGGAVGGGPVITGLSPSNGPQTGGTFVTINGANFSPGTVIGVFFGVVPALSVPIIQPNLIQAEAPSGTGVVDVRVQMSTGISPITPADQFTYGTGDSGGAPVITSLSPSTGPAAGGTFVTINGQNFAPGTVVGVFFGTVPALSVPLIGANFVQAESPPGAGTVDVRVEMSTGITAITPADQFTYGGSGPPPPQGPIIASISPPNGPTTGGQQVNIIGANFAPIGSVTFGGIVAPILSVTQNQIIVSAPPHGIGTVDIIVTLSTGQSSTPTAADRFTYSQPAPGVASIQPPSGSVEGGYSVTIFGSGFTGAAGVLFGPSASTAAILVISDTEIVVPSVPAVLTAQGVTVQVTGPNGTSPVGQGGQFVYTPPIVAISPNSGPITGATITIIDGAGFTADCTLFYGIQEAPPAVIVSPGQLLSSALPVSVPQVVQVSACVAPFGTQYCGQSVSYNYTGLATVSGLSPSIDGVAGGNQVIITGSGFASSGGVVQVYFGGVPTPNISFISDTEIVCIDPPHAAGIVPVIVTVGSQTIDAGLTFTYSWPVGVGGPTPALIACAESRIYDAAALVGTGAEGPESVFSLCDRVPAGRYGIVRTPQASIEGIADQAQAWGLRGVAILVGDDVALSDYRQHLGASMDVPQIEYRPSTGPTAAPWQVNQAQLSADLYVGPSAAGALPGSLTLHHGGTTTGAGIAALAALKQVGQLVRTGRGVVPTADQLAALTPIATGAGGTMVYGNGPLLKGVGVYLINTGTPSYSVADFQNFIQTFVTQAAVPMPDGTILPAAAWLGAIQRTDLTETPKAADIATYLQTLHTSGALPASAYSQTLYVLALDASQSQSIFADVTAKGQSACGYHDVLLPAIYGQQPMVTAYYALVLDSSLVPSCQGWPGLTPYQAVQVIASHEIAEARTDPAPNSGWTEGSTATEDGDLCVSATAPFLGSWVTESVYVNGVGCVAPTPSGAAPAPTPVTLNVSLSGPTAITPGVAETYTVQVLGSSAFIATITFLDTNEVFVGTSVSHSFAAGITSATILATVIDSATGVIGGAELVVSVNSATAVLSGPPTPVAEQSALFTVAVGGSIVQGDAVGINWLFGDGTSASTSGTVPAGSNFSESHVYAAAGTYTVTVIVADGTARVQATAATVVTVTPATTAPIGAAISGPSTGNAGADLAFSIAVTGSTTFTVSWDFGDGSSSVTGTAVDHLYASAGTYTVIATVTDTVSGATGSASLAVSISTPAALTVLINGPSSVQVNQATSWSALLTGAVGPTTYLWTFSDGVTGSGAAISRTLPTVGQVTLLLNVTDNGNTATTSIAISVTAAPPPTTLAVTISGPSTIAPAQAGTYAAVVPNSSGYTALWDFGDGSGTASGQSVGHAWSAPGVYVVIVTVQDTASGVVGTASIAVTVAPTFGVGGPLRPLVAGGLFVLRGTAYMNPIAGGMSLAEVANQLALDFVMIDIDDPMWQAVGSGDKLLALLQAAEQHFTRPINLPPGLQNLSAYRPIFVIFPQAPAFPFGLQAPDGCVEGLVNGYSGPKTIAAPHVPATSSNAAQAWLWTQGVDLQGTGMNHAEIVVDLRNGGNPAVLVQQAVSGVAVQFPNGSSFSPLPSGAIFYDDWTALAAQGGPQGPAPTAYWNYNGIPVRGAIIPSFTPDPPPLAQTNHDWAVLDPAGNREHLTVTFENWRTGHVSANNAPTWVTIVDPQCPNGATRNVLNNWIQLNSGPLAVPGASPVYSHGIAGQRLAFSGVPVSGDDGIYPFLIHVQRAQNDPDLETAFSFVLDVVDPTRVQQVGNQMSSTGVPIGMTDIAAQVAGASMLHPLGTPPLAVVRLPDDWGNPSNWCAGMLTTSQPPMPLPPRAVGSPYRQSTACGYSYLPDLITGIADSCSAASIGSAVPPFFCGNSAMVAAYEGFVFATAGALSGMDPNFVGEITGSGPPPPRSPTDPNFRFDVNMTEFPNHGGPPVTQMQATFTVPPIPTNPTGIKSVAIWLGVNTSDTLDGHVYLIQPVLSWNHDNDNSHWTIWTELFEGASISNNSTVNNTDVPTNPLGVLFQPLVGVEVNPGDVLTGQITIVPIGTNGLYSVTGEWLGYSSTILQQIVAGTFNIPEVALELQGATDCSGLPNAISTIVNTITIQTANGPLPIIENITTTGNGCGGTAHFLNTNNPGASVEFVFQAPPPGSAVYGLFALNPSAGIGQGYTFQNPSDPLHDLSTPSIALAVASPSLQQAWAQTLQTDCIGATPDEQVTHAYLLFTGLAGNYGGTQAGSGCSQTPIGAPPPSIDTVAATSACFKATYNQTYASPSVPPNTGPSPYTGNVCGVIAAAIQAGFQRGRGSYGTSGDDELTTILAIAMAESQLDPSNVNAQAVQGCAGYLERATGILQIIYSCHATTLQSIGSDSGLGSGTACMYDPVCSFKTMYRDMGCASGTCTFGAVPGSQPSAFDCGSLSVGTFASYYQGICTQSCPNSYCNQLPAARAAIASCPNGTSIQYLPPPPTTINPAPPTYPTTNGGAILGCPVGSTDAHNPCPTTACCQSAGCQYHMTNEGLMAIDIAAPTGTPILATCPGTIIQRSVDTAGDGYGNRVVVACDPLPAVSSQPIYTRFAHMDMNSVASPNFPCGVNLPCVGEHVISGQVIGHVNSTGHVVPAGPAGAHLHYEINIGGTSPANTICPISEAVTKPDGTVIPAGPDYVGNCYQACAYGASP